MESISGWTSNNLLTSVLKEIVSKRERAATNRAEAAVQSELNPATAARARAGRRAVPRLPHLQRVVALVVLSSYPN